MTIVKSFKELPQVSPDYRTFEIVYVDHQGITMTSKCNISDDFIKNVKPFHGIKLSDILENHVKQILSFEVKS